MFAPKQPTAGDILQELTGPLVDQSPSGSCLMFIHGIGGRFWWPDVLPGLNQPQIKEEMLESGNLSGRSWTLASIPNIEPF